MALFQIRTKRCRIYLEITITGSARILIYKFQIIIVFMVHLSKRQKYIEHN